MSDGADQRAAIATVAVLNDELRRAMFDFIRRARRPVTREEAAGQVGISRKLAAFHLDKLVEAGLLEAGVRPGTRRVGRVPKAYTATATDLAVRIPAREHDLLASILLDAVRHTGPGEAPADALRRVAEQRGRACGEAHRPTTGAGRIGPERALARSESLLAEHGYEPDRESPGCVRLRSCPFHPVTAQAPDLVCGLNHAFLSGLVAGLGAGPVVDVVLEPHRGECCVELHAARPAAGDA